MPKRKRVYERGDRSFPTDFPLRLGRLREAAGLSWRQFARQVGADRNTVRCWRKGQRPNAAYVLALFQMARGVPQGYDILLHSTDSDDA
jgi:transcriptional regulator with XRE-family HTH domain